ncbi:hypothetical protein L9F63_017276, partial [Diploptera punctata]
SCCGNEDLKLDHIQTYVDQCKEKASEHKSESIKCVGETAGVSDADGKITDAAKYTELVAEMYTDDDLKAKVKEVAPTCIEKANTNNGKEDKKGHKKMAVFGGFMCIKREVEKNCPEAKMVKNDMCQKMREHIGKKGGGSSEETAA